ncbi:PREDICTED: trypsin-1-like [Priapulus caudatus]|uniref:Trypsin-1-like n=1 Tax=Priapulus caudatus TaxID=37621 RepID=A0ABM1F331_PRICU|nr:PREDICTED: trypsin-1-like [Priapulus caudatus]
MQTCRRSFQGLSGSGGDIFITENMICVGDPAGGVGTCEGDSGGPFVIETTDQGRQKYQLHGVVSFVSKDGCAIENQYAVYTKVKNFLRWILPYLQHPRRRR